MNRDPMECFYCHAPATVEIEDGRIPLMVCDEHTSPPEHRFEDEPLDCPSWYDED